MTWKKYYRDTSNNNFILSILVIIIMKLKMQNAYVLINITMVFKNIDIPSSAIS